MIHDITTDGITVWVNSVDGLVGRFGVRGIDIHNTAADIILTGNECLFCTHTETTRDDWLLFVHKMNELYGIKIATRFTPVRFALPTPPPLCIVPPIRHGEVAPVVKKIGKKPRKWNTHNMQLTVEVFGDGVVIRKPTELSIINIGNMNDLLELIAILKKASHRICDQQGAEQCAKEEVRDDARVVKKALKKIPPRLALVK